jgi:hypothetical protein
MKRTRLAILIAGNLIAGGVALAESQYDPGVNDTEIKIGNTMP